MILNGVIKQLHDLRCAEDIPVYYKPAIAEVINVLLMDAQEVRHGKWVNVNPMVDSVQCSNCGYQIQSIELTTPYCPWCGTKMEGAERE